jgi:hypothetical protein
MGECSEEYERGCGELEPVQMVSDQEDESEEK